MSHGLHALLNTMVRHVPVLPETAPFTPEQRAYLNGFFAGLFSYSLVPGAEATPAPAGPQLVPLAILFGSQTGNSESLAKKAAKRATQSGFAPTVHELSKYPVEKLTSEDGVLIITSTYGDGDPPDNAAAFWSSLSSNAAPRLERVRFSVCALGDTNYPNFCKFGRDLDARLETLGAQRVHPRQDCDVEYDREFQSWLSAALSALRPGDAPASLASPSRIHGNGSSVSELSEPVGNSRLAAGDRLEASLNATRALAQVSPQSNAGKDSRHTLHSARLKTNLLLSGKGSDKEVRHFEIALGEAGPSYEPGDALAVWPTNCPDLVEAILTALKCDGTECVPGRNDATVPLRDALLSHFEVGRITPAMLQLFADQTCDPTLVQLTSPSANGNRTEYLRGRDVLDLLTEYPGSPPAPAEFVACLRKLQPRLYSISSSPKAHPGEVHLTVNVVRYQCRDRGRKGVASCFLADRCPTDAVLPIHIHANPAFRPPPEDVPLIMIGPGTGIAPFRAFLEERRAIGASGRNWLFFGDQHAATDFLYRDELEGHLRDGLLHRLDLAWSRDQQEKIYVQHRILEHARELWRWLENGAAIYVCGDATRMARDVDQALRQVIHDGRPNSTEAAADYISRLQAAGRYQRDVY